MTRLFPIVCLCGALGCSTVSVDIAMPDGTKATAKAYRVLSDGNLTFTRTLDYGPDGRPVVGLSATYGNQNKIDAVMSDLVTKLLAGAVSAFMATKTLP